MDKLAYAWFGIPKEISCYTRQGLDAVNLPATTHRPHLKHYFSLSHEVRKTLNPDAVAHVGSFNDIVGQGIAHQFKGFGDTGEVDLYDVSHMTSLIHPH